MRSIIVVASIVLFGGTGSPACAQSFEQLKKWCSGVGVSDEQTIQGCDAVIRSGKQSPEDQAKAFYLRGDTYSGMGQIDRAIQDFDQAIKLKPDYAVAFLNRSWAYDLKDQMDRAIDDMGKFIELQPADPDGYAIRGSKYVRIGQYDRALRDFDQAIKLKPDYARAFSERCRARAIIGQQLEVALADCTMALRLSPSDAVYLDGRGFTNLKLNRTGPAISDYTAALHIKSDRASSFFGRGIARLRNGDKVGGNADIAAAKKLQSTIADDFAKWGVTESFASVQPNADNSGSPVSDGNPIDVGQELKKLRKLFDFDDDGTATGPRPSGPGETPEQMRERAAGYFRQAQQATRDDDWPNAYKFAELAWATYLFYANGNPSDEDKRLLGFSKTLSVNAAEHLQGGRYFGGSGNNASRSGDRE